MSLIPPGLSVAAAQAANLLEAIIIRPRFVGPQGGPAIVADAVLSEDHDDELVITEHPVEQGSVITDHAYKRPARVTLSLGFTCSSPRAFIGSAFGLAGVGIQSTAVPGVNVNLTAVGQLATSAIGLLPSTFQTLGQIGGIIGTLGGFGTQHYLENVYQAFQNLQTTRTLCAVQTGKRAYSNMLIRRLTTHTDSRYENAMILTVDLQEVIITTVQNVQVPVSKFTVTPEADAPTVTVPPKTPAAAPGSIGSLDPASGAPTGSIFGPFFGPNSQVVQVQ